jgi:hypothetical protein
MASKTTKQTPDIVRDYLRTRENYKVARAKCADMATAYNGAAGALREHLIGIFEALGLTFDDVREVFDQNDLPF